MLFLLGGTAPRPPRKINGHVRWMVRMHLVSISRPVALEGKFCSSGSINGKEVARYYNLSIIT